MVVVDWVFQSFRSSGHELLFLKGGKSDGRLELETN